MSGSVQYKWIIVQYPPKSNKGKYALSLAELGIGYYVINKTRTAVDNIVLAFKHPAHLKMPTGAIDADAYQSAKLDGLL